MFSDPYSLLLLILLVPAAPAAIAAYGVLAQRRDKQRFEAQLRSSLISTFTLKPLPEPDTFLWRHPRCERVIIRLEQSDPNSVSLSLHAAYAPQTTAAWAYKRGAEAAHGELRLGDDALDLNAGALDLRWPSAHGQTLYSCLHTNDRGAHLSISSGALSITALVPRNPDAEQCVKALKTSLENALELFDRFAAFEQAQAQDVLWATMLTTECPTAARRFSARCLEQLGDAEAPAQLLALLLREGLNDDAKPLINEAKLTKLAAEELMRALELATALDPRPQWFDHAMSLLMERAVDAAHGPDGALALSLMPTLYFERLAAQLQDNNTSHQEIIARTSALLSPEQPHDVARRCLMLMSSFATTAWDDALSALADVHLQDAAVCLSLFEYMNARFQALGASPSPPPALMRQLLLAAARLPDHWDERAATLLSTHAPKQTLEALISTRPAWSAASAQKQRWYQRLLANLAKDKSLAHLVGALSTSALTEQEGALTIAAAQEQGQLSLAASKDRS